MLPITISSSSSRRHTGSTPAITAKTTLVLVVTVTQLLVEDVVMVECGSAFIIVPGVSKLVLLTRLLEDAVFVSYGGELIVAVRVSERVVCNADSNCAGWLDTLVDI